MRELRSACVDRYRNLVASNIRYLGIGSSLGVCLCAVRATFAGEFWSKKSAAGTDCHRCLRRAVSLAALFAVAIRVDRVGTCARA